MKFFKPSNKGPQNMEWKTLLVGPLMAATLFVTSGCNDSAEQTKLMYMPDMVNSPAAKIQRDYIDPPDHSVAREGMIYPATHLDAERDLKNPLTLAGPLSEKDMQEGHKLFETYCSVCHGHDGKSVNGKILDKFPQIPADLTAENYRRKEGYIFYTITFGSVSKMMPPYGHATSIEERWKIVSYLQKLQHGS